MKQTVKWIVDHLLPF